MKKISNFQKDIWIHKYTRALDLGELDIFSNILKNLQDCKNCQKCNLSESRKNVVYSRYRRIPDFIGLANIMLIGEAPGEQEDESALPFIGESGKLLENMLKSIGLTSHEIYICNIVKCRPPENRLPTTYEINQCLPYLLYQIREVDPNLIICLGNTPSKVLIDKKFAITKDRGKIYTKEIEGRERDFIGLFHPSYLLRNENKKKECWEDMKKLYSHLSSVDWYYPF